MTAARSAPAFLLRAGMFSLVLALIAGIFGMHVMSGHHLMHGQAVAMAAAESEGHSHTAGAAAHGMGPHAHAVEGPEISAAAGCPDGDCSGTQAMTVACTPSVKTSNLTAPAPGTSALGTAVVRAGPAGPVSGGYAYLPGTPSPCQLSISRT
ncbi:hypothetical protein R5O87_10880 [Arthrobacter globiformis]|uniref:hypothetical protein n=1 Tax=Arthrobacter globiformis TaxID=1665 RepID=UPI003979AC8C